MKTRILWSMAGAMTAVALLLVSCGPKVAPVTPTPAPGPAVPAPVAPAPVTPAPGPAKAVIEAAVEKPKYGGTISVIVPNFLEKYDIAVSPG